nr:MAG TPA_asm: hypothetical protein [Caudoviricetes sp.]
MVSLFLVLMRGLEDLEVHRVGYDSERLHCRHPRPGCPRERLR